MAVHRNSQWMKNTLSMIGDIAYRMAVLNPTLGDQVLEKTPGVVLIDEIDLHLHPQWQQTILSDLHAIFPEIQFIVSSHAPAVINSVPREQIRILDHGEIYMPAAQTYGRDANSILREVMNVSDRILVMYEGEIVGEFDPKKVTVEELGLYMAGSKRKETKSNE